MHRAIIALVAMTVSAHAADLSSLNTTPYRPINIGKQTVETKPFEPPPCVGVVWPIKIVRCSVTVKF